MGWEEGALGERQTAWTHQDLSAGPKSKVPVRHPSGEAHWYHRAGAQTRSWAGRPLWAGRLMIGSGSPWQARWPEEHVSSEEAVTRPLGILDLEGLAGDAKKELPPPALQPGASVLRAEEL